MYSSQPHGASSPQWPPGPQQHRIGGGSNGGGGGDGGYYPENPDSRGYSGTPASSDRYLGGPETQPHAPLMGGGTPPASRFADPSSPSPPAPPPPLHGAGLSSSSSSSPSPHRRVLNDPVGGHYTDNPYTRYSTTWDPQLVARQLQTGDPEVLVFSDDDEDQHATGAATATATAAGAAALVVGRSGNQGRIPAAAAAASVERGGLLGSSEGGSTMMLNGELYYIERGSDVE